MMTVLKKANVYDTNTRELCSWALSVADGITGGRWHTDGPGIGSGARGPLGNRSIRWIRLSGARQRHKTGSIQMLSLPFSPSISIHPALLSPGTWRKLFLEGPAGGGNTSLTNVSLESTKSIFLELSYPLQDQDK